jgi:hypothetical protein
MPQIRRPPNSILSRATITYKTVRDKGRYFQYTLDPSFIVRGVGSNYPVSCGSNPFKALPF